MGVLNISLGSVVTLVVVWAIGKTFTRVPSISLCYFLWVVMFGAIDKSFIGALNISLGTSVTLVVVVGANDKTFVGVVSISSSFVSPVVTWNFCTMNINIHENPTSLLVDLLKQLIGKAAEAENTDTGLLMATTSPQSYAATYIKVFGEENCRY